MEPDAEIDPAKTIEAIEKVSEEETPDAVASVDMIAKQVSIIGRGSDRIAEQEILQNFLGWQILDGGSPTAWPSQSDLAVRDFGAGLPAAPEASPRVCDDASSRKRYGTSIRDRINCT